MKKLLRFGCFAVIGLFAIMLAFAAIGVSMDSSRNAMPSATSDFAILAATPTSDTVNTVDNLATHTEYIEQVAPIGNTLAAAMLELSELFKSPQLESAEWKVRVATASAFIVDADKRLQQINPPASIKDIHQDIINASSDCAQGVQIMASALDEESISKVHQSMNLLQECEEKFDRLTKQLSTN